MSSASFLAPSRQSRGSRSFYGGCGRRVGAAFDFDAGVLRQAPRWMQRSGLEWLFRLAQEPLRLAYRYLVYNPLFVLKVAMQLTGLRAYRLD